MRDRGTSTGKRTLGVDVALRGFGLAALGLAWLAVRRLAALHATPHDAGPLALLLSLAVFVLGCSGAACVVMGRHLLDTVEPGARRGGH